MRLSAAFLPIFAIAAALATAQEPASEPIPEAERIEDEIDRAEYALAESLAIARWFAQPESTLAEAEACDLFLAAARLSGKAPLDRLVAIANDNLAFKRLRLGPDDPRLADTLEELGALHLREDDAESAALAYREALRLRRADAGVDTLDLAGAGTGLAHTHVRRGELGDAEKLYAEARDRIEATDGPNSHELTSSLNGLGLVAQRDGRTKEAEALFRRALRVSRDPDVPDHPRTALVARNLARLLVDEGRRIEAVDPMEEAYRIRARRLDPTDLLLSNIAFDLGRLDRDLGDLSAALPLLQQAESIRAERLRPDHRALEEARWELAQLQIELGHFADATSLLDALEDGWPEGEGDRDRMLGVRANLRSAMGDFVEARALYEQLLRRREAEGEDPRVAATLHNLAEVLRRLDEAPAALEARRRAVRIQRETLDPDDTALAMGLANLADLELDARHPELARPLLGEANEIFLRRGQGDVPLRANVLLLLARCDEQEGQPRRALARIDEALDLRRAAYGDQHAEVAWTLDLEARALQLAGEPERALDTALRAAGLVREQMRLSAQTLAERTALRYVQEGRSGLDRAATLALRPELRYRVPAVWDAVVRARSLVLDELIERRRVVGEDPQLREPREALQRARRRLVAASTRPGTSPERQRELRLQKEAAEQTFAAASARYRAQRDRQLRGGEDVRAALEADEAMVSFLRVRGGDGQEGRYVAFVVQRDRTGAFDLGPAPRVDAAVEAWRQQARRPSQEASTDPSTLERDYRQRAQALHALVWAPLEDALGTARRVTLVPDGRLHLVAFESLVDSRERYLAEGGRVLALLSAERDRVPTEAPAPGEGTLLVGGPDFGPVGDEDDCPDVATVQFRALPEAAAEVRTLSELCPTPRLLTGAAATEAAFREQAPGRRRIHVATHGWFLSGDCVMGVEGTRGIGGVSRRTAAAPVRVAPVRSPLLLAGLAFTGVNQRAQNDDPAADGLLTAEEIAGLDLGGTETVVLSACDTGLGEIESGEGVLGLQRAFRLAGARGLVLSLWAVQDRATREWMETFYRLQLDGSLGTAEAAAGTRRAVLESRRARGETTHPFFWAAFVVSGDPR